MISNNMKKISIIFILCVANIVFFVFLSCKEKEEKVIAQTCPLIEIDLKQKEQIMPINQLCDSIVAVQLETNDNHY